MEIDQYRVPAEKLYAVVELSESVGADNDDSDNENNLYACVACTKWLHNVTRTIVDDSVKYHAVLQWPKDEVELQPFLMKPHSEAPSHWPLHHQTRVLKFCATLGQAKTVSDQALTKSDFTDSDLDLSNKSRKRFRRNVERLNYTIDSSPECVNPPTLKRLKITTDLVGKENSNPAIKTPKRVLYPVRSPDPEPSPGPRTCGEARRSDVTPSTSCPLAPEMLLKSPKRIEKTSSACGEARRSDVTPSTSCPLAPEMLLKSPKRIEKTSSGISNHIFLREMLEIRNRYDKLAMTVNKIYNCVCPMLETKENDGPGLPRLPNASFDDITGWERYLHDHDNALHVVRLLTDRCSTSSLRDSVNNILRFLMTNKLASNFNLKGKNKADATLPKLAFEGTKSYTSILAALTAFKKSTEVRYSIAPYDLGLAVGKWLKDAPKRYLLDLRTEKAVPAECKRVPPHFFLTTPENFSLTFN